ncbi:hypothetical protein ACLOJK_020407 [Asimina triloba]
MARDISPFDHLSDSIIILILPFLPFQEAARTSILSKRWKSLWTFTTNIQLHESNFVEEVGGERKISNDAFLDFAQRFVSNYQGNKIEKLGISMVMTNALRPLVEGWIEFGVSRDANEISLEFSEGGVGDFTLPSILLGHTCLKSLKLAACMVVAEDLIRFKLLNSLHLGRVEITVTIVQRVLKECHLLESLSLEKCTGIDFLYISGQNSPLKNLTIDGCEFSKGLSICPNNLKYFRYFGTIRRYDYLELSSAVEVDLDFGMEKSYHNFGETLCRMLKGIDTTKTLRVCSYTPQTDALEGQEFTKALRVLPSGLDVLYLSEPLYVTHLVIKTGFHVHELPGIASIIRSSPCLETLTIEMGKTLLLENFEYPYGPTVLSSARFWELQKKIWFQCFGGPLKKITVRNFDVHENNLMDFLVFLKVNAVGLKTILLETSILNPWSSWSSQDQLLLARKLSCPVLSPFKRVLLIQLK